MTAIIISLWPRRVPDQAVEVITDELSDTHRFERTEDDIFTLALDERLLDELAEVPEFIEETRDNRASVSLNLHSARVLKRWLNAQEDI